jgi:hypothetical protein
LIVTTDLQPVGPQFAQMQEDVIDYLKQHGELDGASIECQDTKQ